MSKVSLQTGQHVTIDFQTASLTQRIVAYGIDLIIIAVCSGILSGILLVINSLLVPLAILPFVLYTLLSEIFMHGQTFGKKAMRLRVVNVLGKEPRVLDYIIRWSFRLVDLYTSLFSVAVILISTTPRAQRLGGFLSNTMVVNLRSELELALSDILKIEDRSGYEPTYVDAYRFRESEMLTVKQVLERAEKYPNTAHRQVLERCARRVGDVLDLETLPKDYRSFLNTVLKDYIVLSRS